MCYVVTSDAEALSLSGAARLDEPGTALQEVAMGLGKVARRAGTGGEHLSAVCIGRILPRESTVSYGSAVPRPFARLGRFANRVGWPLLALGFAAQLVGTVLWT